jgi:hypothetical protein
VEASAKIGKSANQDLKSKEVLQEKGGLQEIKV